MYSCVVGLLYSGLQLPCCIQLCGRPVVQWSAVALLCTVVFVKSLDILFICVVFSLGKKKKTQRSRFGE